MSLGKTADISGTFLSYKGARYFWINLFIVLSALIVYLFAEPLGGHNGASAYGYTVGIISALGIFILMWYGIRKRSYTAHHTTLKGWLAFHVWAGLALVVLVPLHSGFHFAWNIHTLAYVLMVIVVVSGLFGAAMYRTLPPEVRAHRGEGSLKTLVHSVYAAQQELNKLATGKSDQFMTLVNSLDVPFEDKIWDYFWKRRPEQLNRKLASELLTTVAVNERESATQAIGLLDKKIDAIAQIWHDIRVLAALRLWLYAHVPLSCALLVALLIHIFSVFFFF